MKLSHKRSLITAIMLSTFGMCPVEYAQSSDTGWIEAEQTASNNIKPEAVGWGAIRSFLFLGGRLF